MAVPDTGSTDFVTTIITGIIGAAIAVGAYLKGRTKPPADPDNVVITGGSIADMKPVRELATEIAGIRLQATRMADTMVQMLEIEKNRDHAAEIARLVEEGVAERLGQMARRIPDRAP